MTPEELEEAVEKLINEANKESENARLDYEDKVLEQKYSAIAKRIARSSILQGALERLKKELDEITARIQRELDESLEALYAEGEQGGGGSGSTDAPYEVDYSLPMRDRYVTVKNYYLAYEDKQQAVDDYLVDEVAKNYLGPYYPYIYDLLMTYV